MTGRCQVNLLARLQLEKMRNASANSTCRTGNREQWDYTPRERSALCIRNGSNARIYLDPEYLLSLLNGYEGVKAVFHICLGIQKSAKESPFKIVCLKKRFVRFGSYSKYFYDL